MTTHEISEALHNLIALARPYMRDDAQALGLREAEAALKATGYQRPDPQPVDPAWIKRVALEVEERGPVDRYNCAVNALHLALSRGHVVLAPVMPSEEEMLRGAREDAAQVNDDDFPNCASQQRAGIRDNYEVCAALQARRNVYASLGAVGKAVSSGPVVPEVDLRGSLNKAWEAGAKSVRDVVHRHIQALMPNVGTEAARVADVSAILENLKSGEA